MALFREINELNRPLDFHHAALEAAAKSPLRSPGIGGLNADLSPVEQQERLAGILRALGVDEDELRTELAIGCEPTNQDW